MAAWHCRVYVATVMFQRSRRFKFVATKLSLMTGAAQLTVGISGSKRNLGERCHTTLFSGLLS
jgi:hypothetical protein